MELFHIIDEATVILKVKGGVFKQAKAFRRGEDVYAEAGSNAFVRLTRGGGTSNPRVCWLDVEGPGVTVTAALPKWALPAPAVAPAETKPRAAKLTRVA